MKRFASITVMCFLLLLGIVPSQATTLAAPDVGPCNELEVVFVVDQSGSMFGSPEVPKASDPTQLRFFGPKAAINNLGTLRFGSHLGSTIKVAIIDFGDTTLLRLPWTALTPNNQTEHEQQRQQLESTLTPGTTLGNTNFIAGLQSANSLFDSQPKVTKGCPVRSVVILTDGEPAGPNVPSEAAHFAELENYVRQFMSSPDYQIYVIGIDEGNLYWDKVKGYWERIAGDPAKVRRAKDGSSMASEMLQIAKQITDRLKPQGGAATLQCLTGGSSAIPPFTQQVVFTVIKNNPRTDTFQVFDESGQELTPASTTMKVTHQGVGDPIETLTVFRPTPGNWSVKSSLPQQSLQNCQIQLLTFKATSQIPPFAANNLVQFKRLPINLQITESSGSVLPTYSDPKYGLALTANVIDAGQNVQPLSLATQPDYRFSGDFLPLAAGPISLTVRALSHNPDNSELVIIDQVLDTFTIAPVQLALSSPISNTLPQYGEFPLKLELRAGTQPVTIDLPIQVQATFVNPDQSAQPIALTDEKNGSFSGMFKITQPGKAMLTYEAKVQTANGDQSIATQSIAIDVFPTKRIQLRLVNPTGDSYTATDLFLQPTGMPFEVQLTDESGKEVGIGQLGAANPSQLMKLRVLDQTGNPVGNALQLVQTGNPSRFRIAPNTLGPGDYNVALTPALTLSRDYVWAERTWTFPLRGQINFWFFVIVAVIVGVLGLFVILVIRWQRERKRRLAGFIEIYVERPSQFPDVEELDHKQIMRRSMPARSRVIITLSTGLLGMLEVLFNLDLSHDKSNPVRRMEVSCNSEKDAESGLADVKIIFRDKRISAIKIGPTSPPHPLGMGYFLIKGPQRGIFVSSGIDGLSSEFSTPSDPR